MEQEKLSALVDGELDESDMHAVTRKLADPETLASMELYYRIGEELRADSAKASLSQDFSARMTAALAAELPHAPPKVAVSNQMNSELAGRSELENSQGEGQIVRSVRFPGLVA